MAELIRKRDWTTTPLGPAARWSPVLRCAVELIMPSGFPMIVLWGDELVQIYNDHYRDLMGNKHPAGLGQPTRECWPEVWEINAPIYKRVRAGETLTFEDALYPITRSGKLKDAWFTLSYSPLRDDGVIAGVLITVFETTEQHLASTGLQNSEGRYRAFVNASADVVYRMSPDWSQMHELDGRGFIADTTEPSEDWRDIYLLPEDREDIQQEIDHAIATRNMFALEHRVIRADGSPGWTASRAVPVFGEDGAIVEWFGSASDVTERKRAEDALRDSEERLAFLLTLTDTLRPLTDPGEIERAATRLLGEHLHADRCFLSPVTDDGSGMCVREEYLRSGASSVLGDYTFAQFGDFVGPTLHAGNILAVEDVGALPGLTESERASYAATEIAAYLLIPVKRYDRLAAFLTINHRTPHTWSDVDKAVARQTADRLWTARERARVEAALRESEQLRGLAMTGGRMGTWRWDLNQRLVWGDAQFLELWGFPPSDDPLSLSMFTDRQSAAGNTQTEAVVIQSVEADEEFDAEIQVASGPTAGRWLRWRGRASASDPTVLNGVTFDITELKNAEARLQESQDSLREVLNSMAEGFALLDPKFTIIEVNDVTLRLDGRTRGELVGHSHWEAFPGSEDSAVGQLFKRVMRERTPGSLEQVYRWPEGKETWIDVRAYPNAKGRLASFWRDITAQKAAEDELRESERHAQSLLAELQHRVRNTLAVVRSIARRTAENTTTAADMLAHFQGRLDAFSRVQAALTRSPDARVGLISLIEDELIAHAAREGEQVSIVGPDIWLGARQAERISLAIHELTTNAVKHGALRNEGGRLKIKWEERPSESGDDLVFTWREFATTPLEPRSRPGFGTELLTQSLPYDMRGRATLEFGAAGLTYELCMPLRQT